MIRNPEVKKLNVHSDSDSIEIQQEWIDRLREHVEWLNRPDILTDYVLRLRIARRWKDGQRGPK